MTATKSNWLKGNLHIATHGGEARLETGLLYRGLAMRQICPSSPKGRRPGWWSLTHCGTGHALVIIVAHTDEAFKIATEIAECGDWDWSGQNGYRNVDPEVRNKFAAIVARLGKKIRRGGGGFDDRAAAEVALARA